MKIFDVVVIGAGPAGVSAALRAADQGAHVCIVEHDRIGGSCFRNGLYSFKAALAKLKDDESGVITNGVVDFGKLSQSVAETMESISQKWKANLAELGVKIEFGRGIPLSPALLQIESGGKISEIHAKKIILATGSHPLSIPTLPFEENIIISADDVFKSSTIPKSVFIMGSGRNGCEIASLYQRLGSKVFLSNYESRLISDQDPDIIDALENTLKKLKVKLLLDKNLSSYFKNNGRFDITLSGGVKFQAEKIVQNLGREGSSLNLKCESLGIRLGECKEILVNEYFETSTTGIFAAGSVTGRKTTSGVSVEEGRIAADNAMGNSKLLNYDWNPFIVFTEPEIACVGCFADEAHHKGFRAVEGKKKSENIDFGLLNNGTGGFLRLLPMLGAGWSLEAKSCHLMLLI